MPYYPLNSSSSNASGTSITKQINQTAHGFAVGNWVYHTGTLYALTDADASTSLDSVGVVTTVTDANNFALTTDGFANVFSGLTPGSRYYISSTAGAITATSPSNAKAVLLATSATEGWVQQYKEGSGAVASEYGEQTLASDHASSGTVNTPTDVMTFTLPTAGVWNVQYLVNYRAAAINTGGVWFTDSSNVIVPASEQRLEMSTASFAGSAVNTVRITTTGAEVYKLRTQSNASNAIVIQANGFANNTVKSTKVTWNKIGGYIPVVGQSVDYAGIELLPANVSTNAYSFASTSSLNYQTLITSANKLQFTGSTLTGNMSVSTTNHTITVGNAGSYKITALPQISNSSSAGNFFVQIVKNGTTVLSTTGIRIESGGVTGLTAGTWIGPLTVGDTIDFRISSNTAGTIGLSGHSITMQQVGSSAITTTTLAKVIAHNTSGQSIPSSTNTNITNWTELLDSTGAFNPTTGIFTAPRAGQYQVSLNLRYASAAFTAGDVITAAIFKNGSVYGAGVAAAPGATTVVGASGSIIVDCVAGDTINPNTFQGNAAARSLIATANLVTFSVAELPTAN